MTEYPATAIESLALALLTAAKKIISEDEGADIHGRTVEELLINTLSWHPEQNVANWAKNEIHRLFMDFPPEKRDEG